eukprot:UN02183
MMQLLSALKNQFIHGQFVAGDEKFQIVDDSELLRIIIGFIIYFNIVGIIFTNNFIDGEVNIQLKQKGVNPITETKMCIKIWWLFYWAFIIQWHYYIIIFRFASFANIYVILALGKFPFDELIHWSSCCRFIGRIIWLSLLYIELVITLVELLQIEKY